MSQRELLMQHAIEQAKKCLTITTPNPSVGCVIVKGGQVIGEGFTSPTGGHHAEINALEAVKKNGFSPAGATVYVTLEPCAHYGKTPPCANALVNAGVAEVIIGSRDPNPQVSGRGVKKLRDAGIAVTEDVLREQCDELNLGFFKRMTMGLPRVTVKLGMSLDAKVATASGESQWITGEAARADVQQLRARACAVMTSSATVITDNPSLNVRLAGATRQPKRVIIDSYLTVSPKAKTFGLAGEVLIYTASSPPTSGREKYIQVPEKNGHADLIDVLRDLGTNQQCNNILVEAGGRFVAALVADDLVDEWVIYQAPILLGEGAKPAFALSAVSLLNDAPRYQLQQCEQIGTDIKSTLVKVEVV